MSHKRKQTPITISEGPSARYLIHIYTNDLIAEIKSLVSEGKYSHAISAALSKGSFEREVGDDEIHSLEADLILSQNTANWDLM